MVGLVVGSLLASQQWTLVTGKRRKLARKVKLTKNEKCFEKRKGE